MEEIIAGLLELIAESEVVAVGELIISVDLMAELAMDAEVLGSVYTGIVETFETFQSWLILAFDITKPVVEAMLGLQFMYHMIYTHYSKSSDTGVMISISTALEDIEGTLKKHYEDMIKMANKISQGEGFGKLSEDARNKVLAIESTSPMGYWVSVKPEILKALKQIPIYAD